MSIQILIAIGMFVGGLLGLVITWLIDRFTPSLPSTTFHLTAADILRQKNEEMMERRLREEAEKRMMESDPERIAKLTENKLREFMEDEK
jgi:hypothetical protein